MTLVSNATNLFILNVYIFYSEMKFEHAESSNFPVFVTRVSQNPMKNGKKSAMYQWNFENSKDYRKVYGICYRVVS